MIQFNKPYFTNKEIIKIENCLSNIHLSGDGSFTKKCHDWLEQNTSSKKALLTHSCTAALEMAAILANIKPGDEIIMPSYTFVSTANAFVLRGGIPVFVDIRPDTLNIDENLIEAAISKNTKAIVPVHYAGVACEMDKIMEIAKKYNLLVIEDAAQGVMSKYKGRALGSIGHMGCYSFHETKNIISGEGGALLINDSQFIERAEVIREKGTDRSKFFRGQVDKYTWVDIGSSYLPSDIIAAFLLAQLEQADYITTERLKVWNIYHMGLINLERDGFLKRPFVPENCLSNGHIYFIILNSLKIRTNLMKYLSDCGFRTTFHYSPLHNSPAGQCYARYVGDLRETERISDAILRLPVYPDMPEEECVRLVNSISKFSF